MITILVVAKQVDQMISTQLNFACKSPLMKF